SCGRSCSLRIPTLMWCRPALPLRANIAETLLVPLIKEQGGKEIQHEEHEDILVGPGFRAQWSGRPKRDRTDRGRRRWPPKSRGRRQSEAPHLHGRVQAARPGGGR